MAEQRKMAVKKTAPPADKGLLQCKRFWSSIIGIGIMIVTQINPIVGDELRGVQDVIAAIIITLVTGYHVQDAVTSHHEGKLMRESQNGG